MQVLLQRVSQARCDVKSGASNEIAHGLVLFVSFHKHDDESLIAPMAKKIARLRIFEDDEGKMNLNINQVGGSVLSISQFTLEANTEKGHRPSFTEALEPEKAELYYQMFNDHMRREQLHVETGSFGEAMEIALTNDGPVTILLKRSTEQ